MTRHVLEIDDLDRRRASCRVLDLAEDPDRPPVLAGRTVGLYFEKPSLRTRHSSETAVVRARRPPGDLPQGRDRRGAAASRSSDIARVLSGYHAAARRARVRPPHPGGAGRRRRRSRSSTCCPTGPPVPGAGRPPHHAPGVGEPRGPHRRLDRRLQQRGPQPLARRRPLPACALRIASPAGYGPTEADVDRMVAAGHRRPAARHRPPRRGGARAPTPSTPTSGRRWGRRTRPTCATAPSRASRSTTG